MNKGIIAFVILIIAFIIIAYVYTGFRFFNTNKTTTIKQVSYTTTIANTTTLTSTINYSNSVSPCSNFELIAQQLNSTYTAKCQSNGGTFGLWVASGYSGTESVRIVGQDGKVYANQTSAYNCTTFFQNFTAPQQIYTITFRTGTGGGSCGNPLVIINTTSIPPKVVYHYIYNGNFGNGQYTGWNVTNPGFGTAPLNISYADSKLCYTGHPWSNYNGSYFATTYNCGVSVAPGNITSSPFLVDPTKPFVNFRIISPDDNNLYIEILRANYVVVNGTQVYTNSTTVAKIHYNTYNLSRTSNSSSTFANVTIPLTQYINDVIQLRIVAATEYGSHFIAAGDFVLSDRPHQDKGVITNATYIGS
jgi:hypothetical protein